MIRVFAVGFAIFLGVIIYLANTGQAGFFLGLVRHLPGGDFTGHLLLYGTMSLLLNAALRFRTFFILRCPMLWGTVILLAVATTEECSQYFISSRSFDWADMIANTIGIVLFGEAGRWWWKRR